MKRKKLIIGLAIIVTLLGILTACMTSGLSEGANVTLYGIDLSNVPDGNYTGLYEFKRWSNTLLVHVNGNRITDIDIVKDIFGPDVSGEIFSRVIEAQDTRVDAVSGATVTSKAYLKAVEDAFTSIIQ